MSTPNPLDRWSDLQRRIAVLRERVAAAAEIQQSLPLSETDLALERFGEFVDSSLALREGNELAIDARVAIVHMQLDQLELPTIKGLPKDAPNVTHFCVTASKEHGHGIFSAHDNKDDALFNAALTGGKTDYVQRREDDPRFVVPGPALREARRVAAEYC